MDTRYNVYFAGEVLDGQDPAGVRSRLGQLFKADAATLDKLFSGKTQLVKRDCDKATALKYKQAMEQAGAAPVIKAAEPTQAPATSEAPAAKLTAAQRIAMLANAPDVGRPDVGRPDVGRPDVGRPQAAGPAEPVTQAPAQTGAMDVLPPGSEVLRPEERTGPVAATVMAPDLEVATGGERLSATPPASPPAPDTSHLSAAAVGETLPTLPSTAVPLSPDTSALSLSPEGTDFSDCAAADAIPPDIDLSAIDLAPAGADVLEKQYRKRQDQPAPNTDHLSLDD
ncbi:hypothetical protein ACFL3Y_00015 [Pseudomonadota bacterium]